MSDIYLSLTETPSVVTLSQPVVASVMVNTVTVANVVSVNVVTMPPISVTAAGGLTNAELRASAVSVAVTTMPALSISSVSISNFPSTQTIAGTVTANVPLSTDSFAGVTGIRVVGAGYQGGIRISGINPLNSFQENLEEGGGIPVFAVDQSSGGTLAISGTVTVGNSVTIGSLPAISGTVTANLGSFATAITSQTIIAPANGQHFSAFNFGVLPNETMAVFFSAPANYSVARGSVVAGSWTGTAATLGLTEAFTNNVVTSGNGKLFIFKAPVDSPQNIRLENASGGSGSFTATFYKINDGYYGLDRPVSGTVTVGNSITIGSLPTLTPQLPRVTFIDGSGTVVTANSAVTLFASSTTRSYLLVQVTTGSAFVNVGATATTVNGINLTAGQGYAWETTIPQGLVSLISTTTSSRWVAKEA